MKLAVIGATGVLGSHIIPRLIEHGHQVHAFSLSSERLNRFKCSQIKIFDGNILQRDSLLPVVEGCDVVMHVATAVPKPGAKRDWTLNDRIRREGTTNLLAVCKQAGTKLYIQQSIAHLVNKSGSEWLDEDGTINPTVVTQSAMEMEAMVKESHLNWLILRGGSLYGAGTGREEFWYQLARAGELMIPEKGDDYISLVYVSDLAQAFVLAATAVQKNCVINIVDDEPVTYSELYNYIASQLGEKLPTTHGQKELPPCRASNKRAKALLSWRPHYATYRSGLAGILK